MLRSPAYRYTMAAAFVAGATLLELGLWPWVKPSLSPLFTVAVLFSALYGGLGPALLATGLSAVASAFFFLEPTHSLNIGDDALRLIVFTLIAVAASSVAASRRNAELRLAKASEAAARANRAKDKFLAVVSHELRNPLSPILSAAMLIEEDPSLPEPVRQDAQMIRRNVDLQIRIIDDLLDSSRIESGKLELRCEPMDVLAALHDCVAMCAADAAARSVEVLTELDDSIPRIDGDPARMRQVFTNLLRNAIKFTPAGGQVTVRALHLPGGDGGRVRVEVRDTGAGIDKEVLPRLFEAFEQGGRSTTRRYGGLGLGLAIAKAIVDGHGGTIRAHSDGPSQGATFTVELPASQAAEGSRSPGGAQLFPGEADAPRAVNMGVEAAR